MTQLDPPKTLRDQTQNHSNGVRDRMGHQLEVGDLIAYILHHHCITGAAIYVGTITKITKSGNVFAKNIPLVEREKSEEKRIKDYTGILRIDKNFVDQLLLTRLSLVTV